MTLNGYCVVEKQVLNVGIKDYRFFILILLFKFLSRMLYVE